MRTIAVSKRINAFSFVSAYRDGYGWVLFFKLVLCTYPVLPSCVHVCIYFEWFPLWLFLELDFLLWNIVLEVSGPVYNLITRNYATDFNMNILEVSLLL